jgi:hypothetical protein
MPIADLLRDDRLLPAALRGELRELTRDFILRRVRALVDLNPGDRDPAKRDDITAAATTAIRDLLLAELPRVAAAEATIWSRVSADPKHLSLDPRVIRKHVSGQPPAIGARAMRRRLVRSIVYQAAARQITLADPGNVELLHKICDRRLRIVERMLYDVGRADVRAWKSTAAAGPWTDGLERMFEYPRVPKSIFVRACNPDDKRFGYCRPPMADWRRPIGGDDLIGPNRSSPAAAGSWKANEEDPYSFEYTRAAASAPDPVAAVDLVFTPSTDYLRRNLFFCDQVIHSLHLEALTFAESKRRASGDHTWLEDEVKRNGPGWLRLYYQFGDPANYLGGDHEKASWYFESLQVRQADLQVGDHLVVYNHPAYTHTTLHGVWRLENAVVVQTLPELLMQGHGSYVFGIGGAQRAMAQLFNTELEARRADVEPLAAVRSDGPNRVTVDTVGRLRVGMAIDIVHATSGAVLAGQRTIVALNPSTRVVTYDGPDVKATTAHRLQRMRTLSFGCEAIEADGLMLLRRVPAAASSYAGIHQRADWYVAWFADDKEKQLRLDPARAAFAKEHQLVDYAELDSGTGKSVLGFFPLWRPTLKGGQPSRVGGKIVNTEPVVLGPRNIATWTWFFDPDPAKRDLVPVIRPRAI